MSSLCVYISKCVCVCVCVCDRTDVCVCVLEGQELEDQSVTSLQSAARRPYESTLNVCVCACVCVCGYGVREGSVGACWETLDTS